MMRLRRSYLPIVPASWRHLMAALLSIIVALVGMAFAQAQAPAQQSAGIETKLVAEVREESAAAPGSPSPHFAPATVLRQGREVFYTVQIRNPGTAFAPDVVVVQRIPQNTSYVANSAAGPGALISFSADGGQSFGPEGKLTVTEQNGASRPATVKDYTHIRWQLRNPLAPGAVGLARFRAIFL